MTSSAQQLPSTNGLITPVSIQKSKKIAANQLWSPLDYVCKLLGIAGLGFPDENYLFQHLTFKTGQSIYRVGQHFDTLYVINSGFLKTVVYDEEGNEQVLGFPMRGDLLGIDGIHKRRYAADVVALSNCDVILVPFKVVTKLGRTDPNLEISLLDVMSRELSREQILLRMMGTMSAEGRVARFLVFLSERHAAMGYSGTEFDLRATRHEIGNYLGITLETVSRALSAFHRLGLISVVQRRVILHDIPALKTLRRLAPNSRAKIAPTGE